MPPDPPRIDGFAKVRGEKVYARDLRAHDMAGWPRKTHHALLLRAGTAEHKVNFMPSAVKQLPTPPLTTVTASDIKLNAILPFVKTKAFGKSWFVPDGAVPDHAAQPVAMLIFETAEALRDALEWLVAGNSLFRLGDRVSTREQDVRRLIDPLLAVQQREEDTAYASINYVRIGYTPVDKFSHVKNGPHNPADVGPTPLDDKRNLETNIEALQARDAIEKEIAETGWTVISRNFATQTTDPMFMEPEAGIGWWDRDGKELHLVVGTQSPSDDRSDVKEIFSEPGCPLDDVRIVLHACFPGGGFGGRDKSSFPIYLALAAAFSKLPVRLAYDRFEQFLCGIKRHASAIQASVAYDKDGTPQAMQSTIIMDGGGEANLTGAVVGLAALHAAGPYRIPRTVISARGVHTTAAPAGSMRGFGIPQATLAIESLIDEIAGRLGVDPIEYRIRHCLNQGERDVTGMTLDHHLANVKLCEMAQKEPLWVQRNAEKARRDRKDLVSYGVGFACCMEAYGTSSDAALTEVVLNSDGSIQLNSSSVDMGQGSATSIAIEAIGTLGRAADTVRMGESEIFEVLELVKGLPSSDTGNVFLTPKIVNSSSASVTAFHHLHAVDEACKVVFDHGILRAAYDIWGTHPGETNWRDGELTADGLKPIPLKDLAQQAHRSGYVVGAMVHTFFQHSFATAKFTIDGSKVERAIDALAITRGGSPKRDRQNREEASFPSSAVKNYRRTLYASAGHLVAVQVHLPTGRVRVLEVVNLLDAGDVHHQALLAGQVEGGFAMGLGYALLEELPPAPMGVDGSWNLHRYQVPRAKHMPLEKFEFKLVPLGSASVLGSGPPMRKKGIAEATMTTVAPAVVNAVAHAIGVRINSLPITPPKVLEALRSL
ncbi:molybdopterin cofactor-binding domain-containing protein [Singulisphaera sp. Ch08]|uniref:Molybdopterin cofactor-binding domain-containing protein n=1 Tax=Singulisphaera sp. Ch08 TaxID=3120278 RepID=A0AAU7CMT4_9BACT